ncbi:MAG: glutamate synthase-related protein [Terriglobales bacterium]
MRFAADRDACGTGFIVRLSPSGPVAASREPVDRALAALARLTHRGGTDAEGDAGDGAGLLTSLPEGFFRARAARLGLALPPQFAVGTALLPPARAEAGRFAIAASVRAAGITFCGWRQVPVERRCLSAVAARGCPAIWQFFAAPGSAEAGVAPEAFERRLFLARHRILAQAPAGSYIASFSARTIVYKGLLTPSQLPWFYPDLLAADFLSSFAVFHQRYSTNTEPSWSLAQPFRFLAHNGEINTISGNRRWLLARVPRLRREWGAGDWYQPLEPGGSDSASLDNALEIRLRQGQGAAQAIAALVPAASGEPESCDADPWDGPAALAFADGQVVGARLDRNGLRPLRFTRSAGGLLVMASEAGVADWAGEEICERGRLGPGESLWVELATSALHREVAAAREPVLALAARLKSRGPAAGSVPGAADRQPVLPEPDPRQAVAFGFTQDQHQLLFQPLAAEGREAVFSMGDDAPPAALAWRLPAGPASDGGGDGRSRRLLWDYCKQHFAQVTNPPMDALRETLAMSLAIRYPAALLPTPVLAAEAFAALALNPVDITFAADEAPQDVFARIRREVTARLEAGAEVIALGDQAAGAERCAAPVLLAAAAAWQTMLRAEALEAPLLIATGQAWDTHHVAMLLAAGASGVYPYLAYQWAARLSPDGPARLRAGLEAGLKKVLARMGIATLGGYRHAQLFSTVGLDPEVSAEFFPGAPTYLAGVGRDDLVADMVERHRTAYAATVPAATARARVAPPHDAGLYRFRHGGERHANSPEMIRRFHAFVRQPSAEGYRAYTAVVAERAPVAVRDLLLLPDRPPGLLPLRGTEARPAAPALDGILARFSTQAMSLGALSQEVQAVLARGMNRLGARSNTGEGGEDPEAPATERHRVKQVASARFGVTAAYLVTADELEIKMAQGAKPGEGGQLPPAKVTPYIARLRHAVPGMALISPPPHHDIYSIEDLAQLIYDLRAVNPRARIGVKLVAGAGVGIIATGVAKAGADVITIAGHDGGTGASPLSSIKNTGLPWELGLREAHLALSVSGFRDRVRLRADGGFKTGRDVLIASLLGADEFGFGTAALVALGCVMARQCHLNTCPAGIATQRPELRKKFTGTPEMLMAYFQALAAEVAEVLAAWGAGSLDSIRGRSDWLRPRDAAAAAILAPYLPHLRRRGSRVETAAGRDLAAASRAPAPAAGVPSRAASVGWMHRPAAAARAWGYD